MDSGTWQERRRAYEAIRHNALRDGNLKEFILTQGWLWRPVLRSLLFGCGMLGRGYRNARSIELQQFHLEWEHLPAAFDGFRILQISDVHIDKAPHLAETIAGLVSGLSVDLCALTGDFRFDPDGPCERVYPPMETIVRAVRSTEGFLGVLGNHDYAEQIEGLERIGIRMLVNEGVRIRRGEDTIFLAGVDDPNFYRLHDLEAALRDARADEFKILLAHSPEIAGEAEQAGVSFYLCGHTHAGQICLPNGRPILVNATSPIEYGKGLWRCGSMTGYTSRGAGSSVVPVRFNCPPEVAVIELRKTRQRDPTP